MPRKKNISTPGQRIIKKYPNRRLYDTTQRSYITLQDIKKYVLDYIDFRVIDAHTQTDITTSILLQVISENEATTETLFTTELLQNMIRLYQENMQKMFSQYFQQAMTYFVQQKEEWKKTIDPKMSNPFNMMNEFIEMQRKFWNLK